MPKRPDPERLHWLLRQMIELGHQVQPDLIAYETPIFPVGMKMFSTKVLSWLQKVEALVMLTSAELSIPLESYASSQWRATFLGYGTKPKGADARYMKRAVMLRAKERGFGVMRDDEADAIGILWHALFGEPAMKRRQGDLLSEELETL